jgi:hypothetical protein
MYDSSAVCFKFASAPEGFALPAISIAVASGAAITGKLHGLVL